MFNQGDPIEKIWAKQEQSNMRIARNVKRAEFLPEVTGGENKEKPFVLTGGTLLDIRETFFESRWLILGIVLFTLLAGVGHFMIAEPIYRADGLLEVQEAETNLGVMDNIPPLFKEVAPVNTEIEMLKSRVVLGQVVDNLGLTTLVQPVYLPIIGAAIVRRTETTGIADPWFGLRGYAWGGERIKIEYISVPKTLLGKRLTIVAKEDGRYQVLEQHGIEPFEGEVGKYESSQLSNGEWVTLFVSEMKANPETRFEIIKEARLKRINALQEGLTIREKGDRSRLLEIIFDWPDKEEIAEITKQMVAIFVQQNADRRSGELNKTIDFLEKQLSEIRMQMESHVVTLNNYRRKQGVNDLSNQSKIILQKIVSVDTQLLRLKDERLQLIQKFKSKHPRIVTLDTQISILQKELDNLNWNVKRLPDTQQEALRLTRDVEVDTELYSFILNRLKELKIITAGLSGNVNIVDMPAAADAPVKPQKVPLLTLYLLLGISLAVVMTFIRKALNTGVDDPDVLEKKLGYPVYAIVPHSSNQDKLIKQAKPKGSVESSVLVMQHSRDPSSESIRSLRTSLYFAINDAKNNLLLITSPGPNDGKSFLSINLAAVLAGVGKRVLLIDADLRKGKLYKCFGFQNETGLSNVISDDSCNIQETIHETAIENLHFISSGTYPPNPSELLLHQRFESAMGQVAPQYDHVIIDSPPILPVTDAAIIGELAGATFLVVKAGKHNLRAVEECVKRLAQAGANMRGFVFNGLTISNKQYGYGKYYGYGSS